MATRLVLCLFIVCYLANKGICGLDEAKEHKAETAGNVLHTHHMVKISSLLPSNVCTSPSSQVAHDEKASLKLVHKHGPCSHIKKPSGESHISLSDHLKALLERDESRVNSIQSQLQSRGRGRQSQQDGAKITDAVIPAKSGETLGSGDYIVTVGLGTPKRQLSLVFDTGSSLTWTQCRPCLRYCYKQKEPIFEPSQSTSYANISCDSDTCSELEETTGVSGCYTSTCVYRTRYGDGSYSIGFLSKERLTLTPNDVFDNFVFGCGQNNRGLFRGIAGLLGLARAPLSITVKTANRYLKRFSYCVPSSSSSTGFLAFGSYNPRKLRSRSPVKYTTLSALTADTQFYGLDMIGISVAGTTLPIPQSVFDAAGTIIDSGTVITRLPPGAYDAVRKEIRRVMSEYPVARSYSVLDTCYDFSGYEGVRVPRISFFFKGGVEVESHVSGLLIVVSPSQVCFAFIGNSDEEAVGIFGNMQQKTREVVHDNSGSGRVGFGASACS